MDLEYVVVGICSMSRAAGYITEGRHESRSPSRSAPAPWMTMSPKLSSLRCWQEVQSRWLGDVMTGLGGR